MDKEFHYYLTYLTAARAGFSFNEALTISQTCQAVDDNTRILEISPDTSQKYSNYVSQTYSLLRPRYSRMRIYPVFHFIPGNPDQPSSKRTDKKKHPLNTTSDSTLSNQCFDEAFKTKSLMQIGIASHAYADTWAHQNFVGYNDPFNEFKGTLNKLIPNIGHADAKHSPDWPAHIWTDSRLIKTNRIINNKIRFLDAAKHLYEKFCGFLKKAPGTNDCNSMLNDFDLAIGREQKNSNNSGKKARIDRYLLLSERPEYNALSIPDFDFDEWQIDAIDTTRQINDDGEEITTIKWKSPQHYKQTKWFKFQQAIKKYQKQTLELYQNTVYSQLHPDLLAEIMRFG